MGERIEKFEQSEIILYQTEDGKTRIEVRIEGESVWLTQQLMADLFQTTKQNISLHIQNIFEEGELSAESTVKKYLTVQEEGRREAFHRGSEGIKKAGKGSTTTYTKVPAQWSRNQIWQIFRVDSL